MHLLREASSIHSLKRNIFIPLVATGIWTKAIKMNGHATLKALNSYHSSLFRLYKIRWLSWWRLSREIAFYSRPFYGRDMLRINLSILRMDGTWLNKCSSACITECEVRNGRQREIEIFESLSRFEPGIFLNRCWLQFFEIICFF